MPDHAVHDPARPKVLRPLPLAVCLLALLSMCWSAPAQAADVESEVEALKSKLKILELEIELLKTKMRGMEEAGERWSGLRCAPREAHAGMLDDVDALFDSLEPWPGRP